MLESMRPSPLTELNAISGGRRTSVPARLPFSLETDFTRWLESHLEQLGHPLGLRLCALPGKAVGKKRFADLLARNEDDGSLVLIENQLDLADDAHLGQILAYLAGSGAKTLIWIATDFATKRLDAIRWLNEATRDEYRFFAVHVAIAQAEDGDLAPAFDVVLSPTEWTSPTERPDPVPTLGFPANFWTFHLQRHPDEAGRSRAVGPNCRWRATKLKGIVIGQSVQENAAIVFLRSGNGLPLEEAEAVLAKFAGAIGKRGVTYDRGRFGVYAELRATIDMTHPSSWQVFSDWLVGVSDLFERALGEAAASEGRRTARPRRR